MIAEDFDRIARRRAHERAEIREALTLSHARESIDRLLGEELIAAARAVVALYPMVVVRPRGPDDRALRGLNDAIRQLENLVGSG